MRSILTNKKGQAADAIFIIISLVAIGITLLFLNLLTTEIYSGVDDFLNDSADFNDSVARDTLQDIQEVENEIWDWAFLAIYMGFMLQIVILSFAARVNIVFFWLFVIFNMIALFVGVILSNIWQGIASNPEFAETIVRFPITNSLLGTFFPVAILIVLFVMMILLFGKPSGGQP